MPQSRLTGSRIRERRLVSGTKQTDLARQVGISAAYLNLIEHNKRRIGGKLLVDLARVLEVEPASLSEGAEQAMLGVMRSAAAREPGAGAELASSEDFAGRFPGWAGLVTAQHRRIRELEHVVESLSDRLTHDPHLATSLHDVLSTVTAIRSTASILTETSDIDPDWQARFLRNVGEDSARLSESAKSLVQYLDAGSDVTRAHISPQEELSAFLEQRGYQIDELEGDAGGDIAALIDEATMLTSDVARALAEAYLIRYLSDAVKLPSGPLRAAWHALNQDPGAVAAQFGVDPACVMRRVACLPDQDGQGTLGLVVCDGSGTLTFRKPVAGFALPRFGAACPVWPLFQALVQPGQPVHALVEMPGSTPQVFWCVAISQTRHPMGFAGPPVHEATMLISPDAHVAVGESPIVPVGTSCRICPRDACPARREPSILSGRV